MRSALAVALLLATTFPTTAVVARAHEGHAHDAKAAPAKPSATSAVTPLDRLKAMAGRWSGKAGMGEQSFDVNVTYRVTAGGNAVTETLFEGTPHEMTTVYYLQGGELALTHYCASGNHPRMKRAKSATADAWTFEFSGATNFDPVRDSHMHSARMWFDGDDHVMSEWQSWDAGKPGHLAKFDLSRVR